MIEKKCSCERQMIAGLVAGAILTLVVGFVLGWAWDKRDGALSDLSILNIMTALGTIGAAMGAAVTTFSFFYSHTREKREKEESNSVAIKYIEGDIRRIQAYIREVVGGIYHLLDAFSHWETSDHFPLTVYNAAVSNIDRLLELHLPDYFLVGVDREIVSQIHFVNKQINNWKIESENYVLRDVESEHLPSFILNVVYAGEKMQMLEEAINEIPFERRYYPSSINLEDLLKSLRVLAFQRTP